MRSPRGDRIARRSPTRSATLSGVAHAPLADLRPVLDPAPAAWVAEEITEFASSVARSLVPAGYEAYVRIEHGYADDGAETGTLSLAQLDALTPLLAGATTTHADVVFCLWEGFGYLHRSASVLSSPPGTHMIVEPRIDASSWPQLVLPHRNYYMLRGPVHAAPYISAYFVAPGLPWRDGPNLWWPDDRAWFVASEIDLFATYIGCSASLGDALRTDAALDTSVVEPSARFGDDGYWKRPR
jgi:hypothetical protein